MENKKIGIITLYYKSDNYGGNLQAYALCCYLQNMGYQAEQICYDAVLDPKMKIVERLNRNYIQKKLCFEMNRKFCRQFKEQRTALLAFNKQDISHSDEVYTMESIQNCCQYNAYITGSDQIWNLDWYKPVYFLNFVPSDKPRIAYAASIGHARLTEKQSMLFQEFLSEFTAISVREKDAVDLLSPLSRVPVEWCLDPVLLLTREQWNNICEERLIHEPYLFCHFLGHPMRRLAVAFAKKHGLKIVAIPYLTNTSLTHMNKFADIRLSGVSPKGFISLIKHADYVFTDSFHATVFSEIYRTPYAVFRRDGIDRLSSRIYSVTSIFESRERFCDTEEKESLEYIENLPSMEQEKKFPVLESLREKSYRFLKDSLMGI